MKAFAITVLCLLLALSVTGCTQKPAVPEDGVYVVGEHIAKDSVTDFYFTVSTSTFPPHYQRYRFYIEDSAYRFFHETREGDHFPLTEADATDFGTVTLSAEQWDAFLDCIAGGRVIARQEHLDSGDAGPWLYLYWTGDKGSIQEFSFASYDALLSFETLCETLCSAD